MRAILLLPILFFFSLSLTAQKLQAGLDFDVMWKVYGFVPVTFGKNAVNEAYSGGAGFGSELWLIRYSDFRVGTGATIAQFSVDDHRTIGNIESSNYASFYGTASYTVPLADDLFIVPDIAAGPAVLRLHSTGRNFGSQSGFELRLGGSLRYNLSKTFPVFFGIHYVYSKFKVATVPEYTDYFGKASQIQFALGIAID